MLEIFGKELCDIKFTWLLFDRKLLLRLVRLVWVVENIVVFQISNVESFLEVTFSNSCSVAFARDLWIVWVAITDSSSPGIVLATELGSNSLESVTVWCIIWLKSVEALCAGFVVVAATSVVEDVFIWELFDVETVVNLCLTFEATAKTNIHVYFKTASFILNLTGNIYSLISSKQAQN